MAVVLTARTAGLRAKVAAINRSTPASRNHAAAVMAAIVARECRNLTVLRGAQDTNRYIRGWEQAHNTVLDIDPAAGAVAGGRLRMSTVKPSTYVRRIFQRLNQAKKRFTGYLNEEEAVLAMEMAKPVKPPGRQKRRKKGEPKPDRASWRNNGRLKRSEKKIVKIRVVLDRINEQYAEIAESGEGYKFGVVIGARSRGRGVSSIDTIFTKLYGGTARYLAPGVMDVRNLEPHARIVSVKRNITGPATALARAIGMKTVGNAYVARVRKAAGVTLRGSA